MAAAAAREGSGHLGPSCSRGETCGGGGGGSGSGEARGCRKGSLEYGRKAAAVPMAGGMVTRVLGLPLSRHQRKREREKEKKTLRRPGTNPPAARHDDDGGRAPLVD